MLEAKNLVYGSRLNIDNLALAESQVTVVLGANGAGKSTLFSMLAGLMPDSDASVSLSGVPIDSLDAEQRAARIAVMTQRQQLDFAFSVREVILMGAHPLTLGEEARESRLNTLVEKLELEKLLERSYTTLSRGEAQRVQVARVLMQRSVTPGVVLMDEPLTAMDMKQKHQVISVICALKQEGHAILLVLHDLNLAAEFGDQFVLLKAGKLLAQGGRDDVLTLENLSATYDLDLSLISAPGEIPQFKASGSISC